MENKMENETKTRKLPAPVEVIIGVWDEDLAGTNNTFLVKARVPNNPKAIREKIKELGCGTYTYIVGRIHEINFDKAEVDRFTHG